MAARDGQFLDGGLAVDHGGHEFSVARIVLGADDDVVTVEDAGVYHGLPADFEHEEVSVPRHGGG